MDSIFQIFTMLGGLAVFMFGMKVMGDSLENLAGDKMKVLFSKVSNNPIKGIGIGAGVTAIIQSSSATTVMLVGFVNVGFLSLYQAAAIIMGSNIGTTITAQLSSLSALDITAIMSFVAVVGMSFTMFSKREHLQKIGTILLGLGMLFIGLDLMSGSMKAFAFDPSGNPSAFSKFMLSTFTNPFLNLLAGAVFTAIIQSSSAATGILITFASANVITFETAMFMILGTNIGTCITAIIAAVGATTNAKRTATIHLLFNIIGSLVMIVPFLLFKTEIAAALMAISGNTLERAIANFHTIFNVIVTLLLLPFLKGLVKLSTIIVKDKKKALDMPKRLFYIDERILSTPALAVSQIIEEIKNMAEIGFKNLNNSISMILDLSISKESEIRQSEETLNYLNKEITNYLVRISSLDISAKNEQLVGSLYHVVSDIERIGDYAMNITEFSEKMKQEEIAFSEDAKKEIGEVKDKIEKMFALVFEVFSKRNKSLIPKVEEIEEEIDGDKLKMESMHVERLNKGDCSVVAGAIYLSLASQLERVADHMLNIAYSVKSHKERLKEKGL